jgi:hypothetical protein
VSARVKILASLAAFSILAGCVNLGAADCGPDWYSIGQRDGRLGAQPQEENYARRCRGEVDAVRYRDGWQDGFGRRPRPTA